MNKYEVGIIGAGIAGAFAGLRIAENHKDTKTIIFDLGKKPGKRRRQLEGWFGCFPTGDGKIYTSDLQKVLDIADGRRATAAYKWLINKFDISSACKIIKDKHPNNEIIKKAKESGFEVKFNDFIQWKPNNIHDLSKSIADTIENAGNITFSFDNEVKEISKDKKTFIISTAEGDFYCKKLIICVGRSGWRWVSKIYKDLGILSNDDFARYGIRIELPSQHMKEFNKSHCTFYKEDLEIGPFSWNGSIIPEDHADLVISAFRSNEDRWKSDKVSFSLLGNKFFKGEGCLQTDRLGKLAFLLSNDRIGKERIKTFLRGQSQLSLLPEYSWMINSINELSEIIPAIITKGFFYAPHILPLASKIQLGTNLESEVPGLFIAGESAGIQGIAAAGIMGIIASDSACR